MDATYDFRIADEVVGSYRLSDDGSDLVQVIDFTPPGGERFARTYRVRHRDGVIDSCALDDGPWRPCDDEARLWPTAGWPLLIPRGVGEYTAIDEETGATSRRRFEHDGDTVVEHGTDGPLRRFTYRAERCIEIDWGGATSISTDLRRRG